MKLILLAAAILGLLCVLEAQKEPLHMNAGAERANISFTANSIERQDPPRPTAGSATSEYASSVRMRGNVVIRTCCVSKGLVENGPKQAMFIRADGAEYHSDSGEIELHGNSRITFENYPNQTPK